MGVCSVWKRRGHGQPDHSGQAQAKEGGTGELEGRDRAEVIESKEDEYARKCPYDESVISFRPWDHFSLGLSKLGRIYENKLNEVYQVALLERIAYQTSGLALTFDEYLDMVKTNATQRTS